METHNLMIKRSSMEARNRLKGSGCFSTGTLVNGKSLRVFEELLNY